MSVQVATATAPSSGGPGRATAEPVAPQRRATSLSAAVLALGALAVAVYAPVLGRHGNLSTEVVRADPPGRVRAGRRVRRGAPTLRAPGTPGAGRHRARGHRHRWPRRWARPTPRRRGGRDRPVGGARGRTAGGGALARGGHAPAPRAPRWQLPAEPGRHRGRVRRGSRHRHRHVDPPTRASPLARRPRDRGVRGDRPDRLAASLRRARRGVERQRMQWFGWAIAVGAEMLLVALALRVLWGWPTRPWLVVIVAERPAGGGPGHGELSPAGRAHRPHPGPHRVAGRAHRHRRHRLPRHRGRPRPHPHPRRALAAGSVHGGRRGRRPAVRAGAANASPSTPTASSTASARPPTRCCAPSGAGCRAPSPWTSSCCRWPSPCARPWAWPRPRCGRARGATSSAPCPCPTSRSGA